MNKLLKLLRGKREDKKGFTLMEMLIVVAIIAILVAIAVPTFNASLDKAKKAADDANIKTAYTQAVLHNADPEVVAGTVTITGTKITFADGKEYTLQHYKGVTNYPDLDKEWEGDE